MSVAVVVNRAPVVSAGDPAAFPALSGVSGMLIDMAREGARLMALGEALMLSAVGHLAVVREGEAAEELARLRADMAVGGPRVLWDRHDARRWVADEVAAALTISSVTAGRRLDEGQRLVTELPQVLAALAAGVVDGAWVRAVLAGTEHVDPATASQACDVVLARAASQTAGEVRRVVRREVIRRAPGAADEAFRVAKRRRAAQVFADDVAGMACLQVRGPADRVAAAWQAATAVAQYRVDQDRADRAERDRGQHDRADGLPADEALTLDQARADAVLDLIAGLGNESGTGCGDGTAVGVGAGAQVAVIVPAGGPVELVGHGPVPPAAATAWFVDAGGVVTATSSAGVVPVPPGPSRGYVPAPRLAATVRARDVTCRFPGCARAAQACDLDHVTPWPAGATEYDNLAALCRRHHRLKTHSRWRVSAKPGGVLAWVSPTGKRYVTEPPRWIYPPPETTPPPPPDQPPDTANIDPPF